MWTEKEGSDKDCDTARSLFLRRSNRPYLFSSVPTLLFLGAERPDGTLAIGVQEGVLMPQRRRYGPIGRPGALIGPADRMEVPNNGALR